MPGPKLRIAVAMSCLMALVLAPHPSRGEIYTWTDASGHSHYTQDLQGVPAEHRAAARERASASPTPSKVQTFSTSPAAPAPGAVRRAALRKSAGSAGRTHRHSAGKTTLAVMDQRTVFQIGCALEPDGHGRQRPIRPAGC